MCTFRLIAVFTMCHAMYIMYMLCMHASTQERVERKRAKEEAYKEAEDLLRLREMDG